MIEKKIEVIKTEKEFLKNYTLHDLAEATGSRILAKAGYSTNPFGEDRRHENVWEAGEDKPDCIVVDTSDTSKNLCLLDWKGKKSPGYMINERAYNSYLKICTGMNLSLIIAMARINTENQITSFEYLILPNDGIVENKTTAWDKNIVVNFNKKYVLDFNKVGEYLKTL